MCGIIASVGDLNHYEIVLKGLKRLEYRGYDSCGISYVDNGKIEIIKLTSFVDELVKNVNYISKVNCIGHTRWATHGEISYQNTHPFISYHGIFSLVHNGTITNFQLLKEELIKKNYQFNGDTDSEVIVNYLESLYLMTHDIIQSLSLLDKKLEGSYSIVINCSFSNNLFFLKYQTPLLVIKKDKGYILCSDLYAINENNISYYEVKDHQYGEIGDDVKIFHHKMKIDVDYNSIINEEDSFKDVNCYLEKEIYECPKILNDMIDFYLDQFIFPHDLIDDLRKANKIYVIACGTSFNAGLILKRIVKNKDIEVVLGSEFIYHDYSINQNDLCIFISQSGETLDVIRAIDKVDCITLSITNSKLSTIKRKTKYHLDIMVKKEISVASTKAYFGEVIILYILASYLTSLDLEELKLLPEKLNDCLNQKAKIIDIANEINQYNSLYFLGKGINYDLAKECSLKLKEITYIHSEAIYLGELKHGPLALICESFPSILVNCNHNYDDIILNSIQEIKSRKGKIYSFDVDKNYSLSFLLEVYFADLLALYVGKLRKVNIDKPRNLAKSVTVE